MSNSTEGASSWDERLPDSAASRRDVALWARMSALRC